MFHALIKPARLVVGIILLLLGIVALITPLTPGAWLILVGLELIGWGFLIPKKLRILWQESSVYRWFQKKFNARVHPPRGS